MPVYEYECDICEMRFDLRRRFGDSQPTVCPHGHSSVHRVFAPPTIIFKGSGFYVTDNARNGRVSQSRSPAKESSEKQESKAKVKEGEAP